MTQHFNPRSSYEERPHHAQHSSASSYFNPRSSYEERPCHRLYERTGRRISIHAPHTRSDTLAVISRSVSPIFQSTLLIRGATKAALAVLFRTLISIHAPHTRSDTFPLSWLRPITKISIHAPHTRSDIRHRLPLRAILYFNPRSSYEERRDKPGKGLRRHLISIHAPHTRSDLDACMATVASVISIHAPHTRSDSCADAA